MRISVVGTGTMGSAMARTLVRAGFDVTAWNRTLDRARTLEADGITVEPTIWSAVADADVVLTMAFDARATLDLAARFLGTMKEGAIWMQCSTVGPNGMRWLVDQADQYGVALVDAPVVGSRAPAEAGELVMLVSGAPPLIERLQPVLAALGSSTVIAGTEIGQASALKLACNAFIASVTAALGQSVAMCRELGVEPRLLLDTLEGSALDSAYVRGKGAMMIAGDFTPAFAVDGALKDIALMIQSVDPEVAPLLPVLRGAFGAASAAGHGRQDIAAVVSSFS
ncbi:3-hydroxyisobutyrate dehydrogenase [Glaciihabitans tibetensis]|uniref:3-hydroxyisobutyrate dehydrogenase n=1 Tax=Glaciihabitans tibetensis TaxID=1266600 RepID=A0A2T0VIF7_9MICO|nr:NAD(P)-dependent oxidoreductase [Glaciihabitans tibetensis]PRY70014.1 3-hydroxyisobutyrate dehydrogenase [Glaciihabitans tibetensis]